MIRSLTMFALLIAGCDGGANTDPCDARLAALEQRLALAAASSGPSGAPPDVPLPTLEEGDPLEGAPPLLVVSDEVVLAGRGVGGGEDVDRTAETLSGDLRSWARANRHPEGQPLVIALWTSPEVHVDTLVRLLRHAPGEARFALLVRGAPRAPPEDEPSWVPGAFRVRTGDPRDQRDQLDAAWTRATQTCERARAHLPVPAAFAPTGPALGAPSVTGLMSALGQCRCQGTDLPAIEAIATRALVDRDGPVHRLAPSLRFGPPTDGTPALELGVDDDVADLAARLVGRAGSLWVQVP